jgi:acetolactate synthase-1/2/3 large subunit
MFGTIRMHQEREFPTHNMGSHLNNPNFATLAKAYGYEGIRIHKTEEFEPAFLEAMQRKQGTLIEIMLDPEAITTRGTLAAITQNALKNQK